MFYRELGWAFQQQKLYNKKMQGAKIILNMTSGCSTAVELTRVEQNSWGCGFKFHGVLGLFLLVSVLLVECSLFRSLTEVQHYWFSHKNMVSHTAWGETSLIRTK